MSFAVSEIRWRRVKVKLHHVFRTALGEEAEGESILIQIVDKRGNIGVGEIAPSPNVLGTDSELCEILLQRASTIIRNYEASCIDELHKVLARIRKLAPDVVAGIDIALHDIMYKELGIPLWKALGARTNIIYTDYTVSLGPIDDMVREAVEMYRRGFNILKVKLGEDSVRDIERIRNIREALPDAVIRVDANQGWRDFKTALKVVKELEKFNIELVEQPLPEKKIFECRLLRERVSVPIVLDESVKSIEDLKLCVDVGALDGVNIKLMKCGGIRPGLLIGYTARVLGLRIMVGCMLETIVSITAAAALAAALEADYVDLDSPLMIRELKGARVRGGIRYEGSKIILPTEPGLGVEVEFSD